MAFAIVGPGTNVAPAGAQESGGARYRLDAEAARRDGATLLDRATRDATFRFAEGTAPADRQAFLHAVADARPDAQRLIALLDGTIDVRLAPAAGDALGIAIAGDRRYEVAVDIRAAARGHGQRGIDRVVLHELGHVVDFALVTDQMMAGLQAGIPVPAACGSSNPGACTSQPERFAETFAKWAMGDLGPDVNVGYDVPAPVPTLDAWGAPLAALGA